MADFEKLSVLLPAELVRSVRKAVDGERYAVESDVLIDALRDWEMKQRLRTEKLERLRSLIQEGVDSGSTPLAPDEFDKIKSEGRARLAARNAAE
jgi:antitoxin ParD1/3/4